MQKLDTLMYTHICQYTIVYMYVNSLICILFFNSREKHPLLSLIVYMVVKNSLIYNRLDNRGGIQELELK